MIYYRTTVLHDFELLCFSWL